MKAAKELTDLLKKLLDKGSAVVQATVVSVDKAANTCDVEFDGLEIGEVRLKATNEDKKGFKVYPKPGSVVLIEKLGDVEEYFVSMFSEIDEVRIENENCTLQITDKVLLQKGGSLVEISDKIKVESGSVTLKEILTLIIQAVQKTIVLQGTNPDQAKLTEALTKLNTLLQ